MVGCSARHFILCLVLVQPRKHPYHSGGIPEIETKLFHFHRIFKNGGREGVSSEPPLDLLLFHDRKTHTYVKKTSL